jgi:hypothetical protein
MEKRVYILVKWNTEDKSETIIKIYNTEKTAKLVMEDLEKSNRRKKIKYFITESTLVGG